MLKQCTNTQSPHPSKNGKEKMNEDAEDENDLDVLLLLEWKERDVRDCV